MSTYFSADWHLMHANIIKYDGRPFKTVDAMNETIISNACRSLKKGDNFYYLGDFALAKNEKLMESFFMTLAGTGANFYFIKGNHDSRETIKLYNKYGVYLGEQKKVRVQDLAHPDGNQEIVLNHYRMDVWDKSHHGVWHLHGHSHHSLPERPTARCMDVGVNGSWYNYSPVSFEVVKAHMATKNWVPIDHHGKSDR